MKSNLAPCAAALVSLVSCAATFRKFLKRRSNTRLRLSRECHEIVKRLSRNCHATVTKISAELCSSVKRDAPI